MGLKIIRRSMLTGEIYAMLLPVTYEQLKRWQSGTDPEVCFPDLSFEEKRFIVSGIVPHEDADVASFEKEFDDNLIVH
tara:strand:- start:4001 stop:4234 length:234 start_codon:yes stop_codon:yes gene_type:complete